VRAQDELVQRELNVERQEIAEHPDAERRELAAMYIAQGVTVEDADTVSRIISQYQRVAFDTHARLELGVDPQAGGSALQASVASFLSFAIGAFLPLIPWLLFGGRKAVIISICIGAVAAAVLGAAIGAFTGRGIAKTALRQLLAAVVAAGITFGVGHLLGVAAS
jgi:VIT1/CCC1 family predicted Fe2+/Mn2+ transporter